MNFTNRRFPGCLLTLVTLYAPVANATELNLWWLFSKYRKPEWWFTASKLPYFQPPEQKTMVIAMPVYGLSDDAETAQGLLSKLSTHYSYLAQALESVHWKEVNNLTLIRLLRFFLTAENARLTMELNRSPEILGLITRKDQQHDQTTPLVSFMLWLTNQTLLPAILQASDGPVLDLLMAIYQLPAVLWPSMLDIASHHPVEANTLVQDQALFDAVQALPSYNLPGVSTFADGLIVAANVLATSPELNENTLVFAVIARLYEQGLIIAVRGLDMSALHSPLRQALSYQDIPETINSLSLINGLLALFQTNQPPLIAWLEPGEGRNSSRRNSSDLFRLLAELTADFSSELTMLFSLFLQHPSLINMTARAVKLGLNLKKLLTHASDEDTFRRKVENYLTEVIDLAAQMEGLTLLTQEQQRSVFNHAAPLSDCIALGMITNHQTTVNLIEHPHVLSWLQALMAFLQLHDTEGSIASTVVSTASSLLDLNPAINRTLLILRILLQLRRQALHPFSAVACPVPQAPALIAALGTVMQAQISDNPQESQELAEVFLSLFTCQPTLLVNSLGINIPHLAPPPSVQMPHYLLSPNLSAELLSGVARLLLSAPALLIRLLEIASRREHTINELLSFINTLSQLDSSSLTPPQTHIIQLTAWSVAEQPFAACPAPLAEIPGGNIEMQDLSHCNSQPLEGLSGGLVATQYLSHLASYLSGHHGLETASLTLEELSKRLLELKPWQQPEGELTDDL